MITTAHELDRLLHEMSNTTKIPVYQRFFKTGKGEYGEGDQFLGIPVPKLRALARQVTGLDKQELETLLQSPIHEIRLVALLILVDQYKKATETERGDIIQFYLAHTDKINNWDLVDLSAYHIIGEYFLTRPTGLLDKLAHSPMLWERRIAIVATFAFIRVGQYDETLRIADVLLRDTQDLIHKAVGWMLREVGKRDQQILEQYLCSRHIHMPRTMLRYAIERFPENKRQDYLRGRVHQ